MSPCAPQSARRDWKERGLFLPTQSWRYPHWGPAPRHFCCACAGLPARMFLGFSSAISRATSSCSPPAAWGQGALARKRADEAALDLAMGLAGRRRGVSCRDPCWPLEPRLLCLLGAAVRLG